MDNSILISAHSILRWAVLLFGLYAITKSARGVLYKQDYTSNHNLAATLFIASVHLQVVIGLLLYVARGWADSFSDMAATMGNAATESDESMSAPILTARRPKWSTIHPPMGDTIIAGSAETAATNPANEGDLVS